MSEQLDIQGLFGVAGKVVLITGGGRGIGRMMAEGFVRNGAKVYIASRDIKACEKAAEELNKLGPGQCIPLQANLNNEAACKALAQQIASKETRLDVLINNSGFVWGGDINSHPEHAWDRVLSLNVKAPFFLVKELLPLLDEAATSEGGARVINVGSIGGLVPQNVPALAYDTSKAAVHHLTRVLAAKLARRPNGGHIAVNAIAPGLVPTKMTKGIELVTGTPFKDLASYIPLERYGYPHDMAGIAIFLSSRASSWITGVVIAIDGGQVGASETYMDLIARADFLLVAAGAGFSADSGLPVYNDIANVAAYQEQGLEYQDLCDPYWLEEDPELFLGFWGGCLNMYRDATHHDGYKILQRWKQRMSANAAVVSAFQQEFQTLAHQGALPTDVHSHDVSSDPFFVYTSNVDAHFLRDFAQKEVYEIHGNVEAWQCATPAESKRRPCEGVWRVPSIFRFDIDSTSLRARDGANNRAFPRCRQCSAIARPNVLMFHDKQWIANVHDERRYVAWEAVMEYMLSKNPALQVVVLEIGCGTRVPSVRKETEMVVADIFEKCGHRSQAHLVRINPDALSCEDETLLVNDLFVPIQSGGLAALKQIDELIGSPVSSST
ncbi:TPA: hypothetical protein N0F65_012528 [Lagenidium giganteum]|uniref:Deacetylase sirtuin-type domain-containing protein n=1 Tax=Lagenidium giganteum TaxID=4803 RepID=A0AAV2YNC2_9STRA|nr:TPA: hypothetical protein N0F65_012528 [Lagenidium giganteum]